MIIKDEDASTKVEFRWVVGKTARTNKIVVALEDNDGIKVLLKCENHDLVRDVQRLVHCANEYQNVIKKNKEREQFLQNVKEKICFVVHQKKAVDEALSQVTSSIMLINCMIKDGNIKHEDVAPSKRKRKRRRLRTSSLYLHNKYLLDVKETAKFLAALALLFFMSAAIIAILWGITNLS